MEAARLDLGSLLRPGDHIVVGQATAEPVTLTRRLAIADDLPPGCTVFVGPLYSDTFASPPPDLRFASYGAIGSGAAALAHAGLLDVLPVSYSALAPGFAEGRFPADCVMVQLAPAPGGGYNLGLAHDYLVDAARRARLVIAEINEHAPVCHDAEWPSDIEIHVKVEAESAPLAIAPPTPSEIEKRVAANVAKLVPDGAALQFGVGSIPQAVTAALKGHKNLGIHSGVLFDGMLDLIECGAVTNTAKNRDESVSITGLLIGSRRLYDYANDNRAVRLAPSAYTHGAGILAEIPRFCAINSAVEVDLGGQVNGETARGRQVGATGGQLDFVRGANASQGGRAIIALPSTAKGGARSRISFSVETVTCPRSEADAVVTEWGIAELRGCTLAERADRMIAIAAPQFREEIARQWHDVGRRAYG